MYVIARPEGIRGRSKKRKKVPKKERIKEEEKRARRKRRENRGVEWWACESDSTCLGCARTIYTGMAAEASWTFSSLSLARRSLLPPTLCIFLPPFLLFCLISLSFSFCQSFFVFVHASPTSWLSRHFVSFFLPSIQLVPTLFLSRSLLNAREDRAPRIPRLLVYAFAYVCIYAQFASHRGEIEWRLAIRENQWTQANPLHYCCLTADTCVRFIAAVVFFIT